MKKLIGIALIMSLLAACETMQKKDATVAPETKAVPKEEPAPAASAKPVAPQKKLGPKAQAKKDAEDKKAAQQAAAAEKKAQQAASAAAPAAASDGKTQEVKGINDWTGQIVGTPIANSKFSRLKIGMGMNEVTSIAGQPTDTGTHMTGKAWIPFYMGAGRHETIYYYKGLGRLTFSGGGGVSSNSGLTVIEYDKSERGFQ